MRRETIGDLVRTLGIERTPHPHNGRGIALDEAAQKRIRRALKGR